MQRTIKLKITTTRKQAVTVTSSNVRAYCAVCQSEVPMLSCAETAGFLGVEDQTLVELIAVGKVHATRTISGTLRICQNSLLSQWKQTNAQS